MESFKRWLFEGKQEDLRDFILKASQGLCDANPTGVAVNCRLFVQLMSQDLEIDRYPEVPKEDLQVGDVLAYGQQQGDYFSWGHYAIYLGNGEVIEVPQMNDTPRINKIRPDKLDRFSHKQSGPVPRGPADKIIRPNWGIEKS